MLDKNPYYGFEPVESLRAKHLLDNNEIEVTDFGTGKNRREKISAIAEKSLQPKKYSQLLFRIINRFQPETILELGTSLGITTLYLSMPVQKSRVITLEGSEQVARLAELNFRRLKKENIELIVGEFGQTLSVALHKLKHAGFVYFDGNHTEEATLDYFEKCLHYSGEKSIFVFDDIHWSKEMEHAWKKIISHSSVTLSIDLLRLGIVFFSKGMTKEEYVIRF